jgi:hypothetical protein
MATRFTALMITAVVLALAVGTMGAASDPRSTALREFTTAVHDYVMLHRRIDTRLPRLGDAESAQRIVTTSNALAAAIQAARPNAHEGDLFTPAVATAVRAIIANALESRGFLSEEMVADSLDEADPEAPLPVVNGRFPWLRGAATWSCILTALPALPEELQYRFVARDLVLVDIHADLVVDILRDAIR